MAQPIHCYVYTVRGFDSEKGQWAVLVDTNNNLDFGDETAVYPEAVKTGVVPDDINQPIPAQYELYQHGKVMKAQAAMVVKRMGDIFLYNFPQHAVASFQGQDILISGGFSRLNFEGSSLTLPSAVLRSGKVDPEKLVKVGELIKLGGVKYRHMGVDFFNQTLDLERVDPNLTEYTLQLGQPFYPFQAKELSTGKTVSLADYKGKYVYIDFWATWCRGCVADMPELKKLYKDLDKNRFAFLGVVANDNPDRVRTFLKKEAIDWPQIVSDSTDKIAESYKIRSLPVTVLLDPNGKIIARDLQGQLLAKKLKAL